MLMQYLKTVSGGLRYSTRTSSVQARRNLVGKFGGLGSFLKRSAQQRAESWKGGGRAGGA